MWLLVDLNILCSIRNIMEDLSFSTLFDWSKEHVFLDQELCAIVPEAELGNSVVDKLVQVQLLHGGESWLYIHVEVQSARQKEFAKRMFIYNNRIFDRYHTPL